MRSHSTTMHCTILVCKAAWQERFPFLHFSLFFLRPLSHIGAQIPAAPALPFLGNQQAGPPPPLSSRRAESPNPK